MKHHDLNIHPKHYGLFLVGMKNWEIRFNDRDFQEGDTVTLHEWDPESRAPTGAMIVRRRICHILRHDDMPDALQPGWCIFTHEAGR